MSATSRLSARTFPVLLSILALLAGCGVEESQTTEATKQPPLFDAQAEVSKWVELWGTYDLDMLEELFVQDSGLTYFSSELEGLMSGGVALREHHEGFGFVTGGLEPEQELWVEDVHATDLGGVHVVAAIWYFGDRAARDQAGHGPMTVVYVPDGDVYKITHMHFANYTRSEQPGNSACAADRFSSADHGFLRPPSA